MRLMQFDLSGPKASVQVKTISTYYKSTASKLPTYSAFYKEKEKPTATDEEFIASDEFALDLDDFQPASRRRGPRAATGASDGPVEATVSGSHGGRRAERAEEIGRA